MNIELDCITKRFGAVVANDGISMTIAGGTIHGLLGENGAGKTTLMKILSGYQSCDAGTITLDGQAVRLGSPAEAIRAGIGMLHQDPLDVPQLSVLDNFMLGREGGWHLRRRAARRDLDALCRRFGFVLDPEATVGSLTVGERQQLELVRLLSLGIRTIILDEPTTGISAPQKALLFETLQRLAGEGLTVIFVSHKLDEVRQLCSRATVLRRGRVAGEVCAPFSDEELVTLMFDQCLERSPRRRVPLGAPALTLQDASIRTYRLTVRDLVAFGRFPHTQGRLTADDQAHIDNALAFLGLTELQHRFVDELSGGQRQRAFVAMVICQDTDYVLLDEPLNNLDMRHSVAMMQHLRRIASDLGKTIVIVVHDINFASVYSDTIIAMREGHVVVQGSPDEVMHSNTLAEIYDMYIPIHEIEGRRLGTYYWSPQMPTRREREQRAAGE